MEVEYIEREDHPRGMKWDERKKIMMNDHSLDEIYYLLYSFSNGNVFSSICDTSYNICTPRIGTDCTSHEEVIVRHLKRDTVDGLPLPSYPPLLPMSLHWIFFVLCDHMLWLKREEKEEEEEESFL